VTQIISISNQKGGVGKTTTAINLGASLAAAEKRTLIIDLDPQANATTGLGLAKVGDEKNSYRVMSGDLSINDALHKTDIPYLKLLPSTIDLAATEVELVGVDGREYCLKDALKPIIEDFDVILIDSPPALGFLTINALTASSSVLIPVQTEYYALEGLSDLLETIRRVQVHFNPDLKVEGVLLTMYDGRTNLGRQVVAQIREHFDGRVFEVVIPRNVRLSEAPSHGMPVLNYDFYSKGAQSYLDLAKEFLTEEQDGLETKSAAQENRGAA
jgi:chromosome partitioning protein